MQERFAWLEVSETRLDFGRQRCVDAVVELVVWRLHRVVDRCRLEDVLVNAAAELPRAEQYDTAIARCACELSQVFANALVAGARCQTVQFVGKHDNVVDRTFPPGHSLC